MTIEEKQQLFIDISACMKRSFPYYESDDKDDYLYLVRRQHVQSATQRIIEYLAEKGLLEK